MKVGSLILPLVAGFGYACGAIAVKRSLQGGISGSKVNFYCNATLALFFQLFWFFPGKPITPALLAAPALCGSLFFLGQIATFRALSSGDVSMATPLLGVKVILVALFSLFIIGKALPVTWWIASFLASLGIALISYSPGGFHRGMLSTICWSLSAAALFALTDVFVQYWVPLIGYTRFASLMFGVTGLLSLIYLPELVQTKYTNRSSHQLVSPQTTAWLLLGGLLIALQALAMYSAIGLYGSATLTNILYGSRCLWSVLLVWILGAFATGSVSYNEQNTSVMKWRFAGALFLFSAMALVLH